MSPRGRQIITMHHGEAEDEHAVLAGSKSSPKIDFIQSSSRSSSMPPITTTAATATPTSEPMPPSTTIARIVADFEELERAGADVALARAEERACKPTEQRAHGEGGELGVDGVEAERAAGDLVLAQRFPGAPDGQPPHALRDEGDEQRQRQDHVVEKDRAVDGRRSRKPNRLENVVPPLREVNGSPKKVMRGV